jgi:hypothetical protein
MSYHSLRLLPERYVTPEKMIAESMNMPVLEPNPVFITLGLVATLSALLFFAILVIKDSDLASGEEE